MSTMYERAPAKYCGPHKKRCKNKPDDMTKIENPPAEGAFWIDGENTFVDEKQGIKHVENYKAVIVGAADNTTEATTTEAAPP